MAIAEPSQSFSFTRWEDFCRWLGVVAAQQGNGLNATCKMVKTENVRLYIFYRSF